MTNSFILSAILLYLCHYTISRILPNDIISYSHIKYRMQDCVYGLQRIYGNVLFVYQMIVEELYFRVFHINYLLITKFISNKLIEHIDIIGPSLSQIVLGTHISVKCHVNRCMTTYIRIQSIHLVTYQLLFFLS